MPILPGFKTANVAVDEAHPTLEAVTSSALKHYIQLGIPETWLSGPIKYVGRPSEELSNGRYDVKSNTINIYMPQRRHVAVDLLWSLTHELAHRIWHQGLSKQQRDSWLQFFGDLGKQFSPEAIDSRVKNAQNNSHDPFWFWYKKNIGSDVLGFRKYLSSIKYISSEIPRDYASSSPEEAWADTLTHIALGRSRNGFLMRKAGSEIRQFILNLLKSRLPGDSKVIPLNYSPEEGK